MRAFRAVCAPHRAEQIIRRSRFIGWAVPAPDEQALARAIQEIRGALPGATHVCFGGIVGGGRTGVAVERFSDAGEPPGTAGRPILEVVRRRGLVETVVVVGRYFGGVLLGAAGLVRAYSSTAALVLDGAPIGEFRLCQLWQLAVPYERWGMVQRLLETARLSDGWSPEIIAVEYGAQVGVRLAVPFPDAACLAASLSERTGGVVVPVVQGEEWRGRRGL
ncbi:MAG: YigZ family protein [Limnochordales bacterium]|nr:YigZ family protein [Limnochordales bacterium]